MIKVRKNSKGIDGLYVNGTKARGAKAERVLIYCQKAERLAKTHPIYEIEFLGMHNAPNGQPLITAFCDYVMIGDTPFIVDLTIGNKSHLAGFLYGGDGSTGCGDGITFRELREQLTGAVNRQKKGTASRVIAKKFV